MCNEHAFYYTHEFTLDRERNGGLKPSRSGRTRTIDDINSWRFANVHTSSAANKTGAVAIPDLRSFAAGFPSWEASAWKSKRSSTNWKAMPRFLPNWKAVSCICGLKPASTATWCNQKIKFIAWLQNKQGQRLGVNLEKLTASQGLAMRLAVFLYVFSR